jgi:hypothetical protein
MGSKVKVPEKTQEERELIAWFAISALRIQAAERKAERRAVRQALGMIAGAPEMAEGERAGYFAALGLL